MTSKLMQRGSHEVQDELESTLSQAYSSCQGQLSSPYHIPTASTAQRGPLTQALLYAILTQPQGGSSSSFMNHLTTITSDGYASFASILHRLVNDSYPKLLEQPRTQVIWLLKQLISLYASDVDNLCLLLLRQIVGGDLSSSNIWLAMQLLDVLNGNMTWVIGNPGLLTGAVYTYLRILPDHSMAKNSSVNELRQAEIKFCTFMLREHFQECLVIGRDLVRLLQDVASIPEFESIWRDLLSNPGSFKTPSFTDVAQLYVVRTPTRYFQSRLTPDMEAQIKFMLTHVRMGNQRRYQTWFCQRFMSTPESESLVCDLLRYICCVHHPSNQILQSDILPRWASVGWLLKCCKSNHMEANAKLALFYDWLFFVPKMDNIMNIEPAILVMVHSIPKYADMTNALLEFLFLLMDNYDPLRRDLVQRGITASVDILVGKGVVRSLEPLSASSSIAAWLREKLSQQFPTYCRADAGEGFKVLKPKHDRIAGSYGREETTEGQSSEDKGDLSHQDSVSSENASRKRRRTGLHDAGASELQSHLEKLSEALALSQDAAMKVLESSLAYLSSQDRAEKFASQITDVLRKGGYEMFSPLLGIPSSKPEGDETMTITSNLFRWYVGSCFPHVRSMLLFWYRKGFAVGPRLLCYVSRLAEELEMKDYILNSRDSEGKAEAGAPHSDISEEDEAPGVDCEQHRAGAKKRLQRLNSKSLKQKNLHQAFHLAVADGFKAYEEFLRAVVQMQVQQDSSSADGNGNLDDEALLNDLKTCLVWNICRLQRILPSVYRYLPNLAIGNEKVMHLTVSVMSPGDIFNVELRLALGELSVIGSQENAMKLMKVSLTWDSIEQQYFWKLLIAEVQGCGALTSLQVLKVCASSVNPEVDVEALSGLLSLLRTSSPSPRLSSTLLSLPSAFAKLVVGVFTSWMFGFFPTLLSCLNQLNTEHRKDSKDSDGGVEKVSWPTLDALLNHLNDFELSRNVEDRKTKETVEVRQALVKLAASGFSHEDETA